MAQCPRLSKKLNRYRQRKLFSQRGSTKTPQLKHSNVAEWLDDPRTGCKENGGRTPDALVGRRCRCGFGRDRRRVTPPFCPGFAPFEGTLWPFAANALPNAGERTAPRRADVAATAGQLGLRGRKPVMRQPVEGRQKLPARQSTLSPTLQPIRIPVRAPASTRAPACDPTYPISAILSGALVRALFFGRFLVLIGHLWQLVCNAPVAVDAS